MQNQLNDVYNLNSRYSLKRKLGQGAFGITYLAWDKQEKREVAVKIWQQDTKKEAFEAAKDFFLKEGKIPGLVEIYDFFERAGMQFLVMEYLSGGTLKEYIHKRKKSTLSPMEAVNILVPVMEAVAKLHSEGMVHCDISPDNLMFDEDSNLCMIDLGAIRKQGVVCEKSFLKEPYSAPEQYTDTACIGPWTDIYSICAIFYEMITGEKPMAATERMKYDRLQPVSAYTHISAKLEHVFMRGLEYEIRDRYYSIRVFMEALSLPVEKIKRLDGSTRRIWGTVWLEASTENRRTLMENKGRVFVKRIKYMAVGLGAVLLGFGIAAGAGRWYFRRNPEKLFALENKAAQIMHIDQKDKILVCKGTKDYEKTLKYLQTHGALDEDISSWDVFSFVYDLEGYFIDKKELINMGVPYNLGRKMLLNWQTAEEALFYLMDIDKKNIYSIDKKYNGRVFLKTDFDGQIMNGSYVERKYEVKNGDSSDYYTLNYDPVDGRTINIKINVKGREKAERFLTEALPTFCPEMYLTAEEARKLLETENEITETGLNEKAWMEVQYYSYADDTEEDGNYYITLAASCEVLDTGV